MCNLYYALRVSLYILLSLFPSSIAKDAYGESYLINSREINTEKVSEAVSDFINVQRAPVAALHSVVFSIVQKIDVLENLLHDIYEPSNVNYGRYMTRIEIADQTTNPLSTQYVLEYLKNLQILKVAQTNYGEYVTATATVGQWEALFNTTFYYFQERQQPNEYAETKAEYIIRSLQYDIPRQLSPHVKTVLNTVQFPRPRPSKYSKTKSAATFSTHSKNHMSSILSEQSVFRTAKVTPNLLHEYYNISTYNDYDNINVDTNKSNTNYASQAVFESIQESISSYDLIHFQMHFNLSESVVMRLSDLEGDHNHTFCLRGDACAEANLDVQYMMAIAPHVPTYYYYVPESESFTSWIVAVANMSSAPPLVISISYGIQERFLLYSEMVQFNIEAQKLALQGVTLIASSGDDGVAGEMVRGGKAEFCGYNPIFPASSPFVTAVGGTMGPEAGLAETACRGDAGGRVTSGGGFSEVFAAPKWQQKQIERYFAEASLRGDSPVRGYNSRGRGYPDVSVLAHNYEVMINGSLQLVSGTSASAPVVAAMVSLINVARLRRGHPAVGWLNPLLYAAEDQFANDVTTGHNKCVADGSVCCAEGFSAAAGWDPVTGLGSINHGKLLQVLMNIYNFTDRTDDEDIKSEEPSNKPTATPTSDVPQELWIYYNEYNESLPCDGGSVPPSAPRQLLRSTWLPADTCLPQIIDIGNESAVVGGYFVLSCGSGYDATPEIFVTIFNAGDSNCSAATAAQFSLSTMCRTVLRAPDAEQTYADDHSYSNFTKPLSSTTQLGCFSSQPAQLVKSLQSVDGASTAAWPAFLDRSRSYDLSTRYGDQSCSSAVMSYEWNAESICYPFYQNGRLYSQRLEQSVLFYYEGGECNGSIVADEPLFSTPSSCDPAAAQVLVDGLSYSSWQRIRGTDRSPDPTAAPVNQHHHRDVVFPVIAIAAVAVLGGLLVVVTLVTVWWRSGKLRARLGGLDDSPYEPLHRTDGDC